MSLLYREKALEKLSSPEQLDQLITVVNPRSWIALLAVSIIVFVFIFWLLFGSVPITIDGDGIITDPMSVNNIVAEESGLIKNLQVNYNDLLEKDQEIAALVHPKSIKRREIRNNLLILDTLMKKHQSPEIVEQLEDIKEEVKRMQADEGSFTIKSPMTGRLVSLWVSNNDFVRIGDALGVIESETKDLKVLIYMPISQGQQIQAGMKVEISPDIVNKEDYGFILGEVTRINKFPETKESIMRYLHNESLAKRFLENGTQVMVVVKLIRDPDSYSGFKWSSGKGPQVKIGNDTLCSATITLREIKPLSFFFSKK